MRRQTAISARIDNETLWEVNQETMGGGLKRNRMINEALRMWLELGKRRKEFRKTARLEEREKLLRGFLDLYFPEAILYQEEITIRRRCDTLR